jgi:dephospho-CoA kinase
VVHDLYDEPEVAARVAGRFGAEIIGADGRVDRAALGARAFGDSGGIEFLEALLHPLVAARRARWEAAQLARTPPPPLLVSEVPLLYEAGAEGDFDAVIAIGASEATRRRRAEARGQAFAERSARQASEAERRVRADRWYDNEGSLADLERWVGERFSEYAGRPCGH